MAGCSNPSARACRADGRVEHRAEGQGQITVSDRTAEGTRLGSLDVDMDPLMVSGRVGELVDPILGDVDVFAVGHTPEVRGK